MLGTWHDAGRMQRDLATIDARTTGEIGPRLIGFRDDQPLVLIALRPFAPGAALGPVVEALAFALPFGATQVSLALPSRAWSLEDPIPPVSDGVDLRQRVLMEMRAEAGAFTSHLHPFELKERTITWEPTRDDLGMPEGQVAHALQAAVVAEHDWGHDPFAVVDQLVRLGTRGHEVALSARGELRLGDLVDELETAG